VNDLSTNQANPLSDELKRRGALVLRTLPILLIPIFVGLATGLLLRATVGAPLAPPADEPRIFPLIPIVVLVIFFSALIILVRLGRPTISALVLIGMWTLGTTLASLRFGVSTYFPALLIMPICAAGLLIDGTASVSLAALATLLVASIAWMETRGLIFARPVAPPLIVANLPLLSVGYWIAIFWTVAALTSLLAGSLQRALRQSHAQAQALSQLSAQLEARVATQTAELAQRAARAEALYGVSRALTNTLDLAQVLGLIAEQSARLLRFDASLVLLAQPDGSFAQGGAYHQPSDQALALIDPALMTQALAARDQPSVIQLAASDTGDPRAALVLPMLYGTNIVGVLMLLESGNNAERGPDDLALAEGFAGQAAVAIVNAQLLTQAREKATLEERTRLARDIHDTLAQGLTGVVVQLGAAQRALAAAPHEAQEHLDLAQRMARESLAEARRSVWNLRAPALERGDLSDALRALVAHPLQPDTTITFEQRGEPWPLPPSVESALLRVGQEALVNVAKHARASCVTMLLEYTPAAVCLTIADNGVGFDEAVLHQHAVASGPWSGFGLLGMRERITALGGTLELTNKSGAQVLAIVPR